MGGQGMGGQGMGGQGMSEPHDPPYPGDTIQEYAWDLDDDGVYDDAFGPTLDVTAWFTALGPGSYKVRLRVTDTTATSYPSFPDGDLSSFGTADVFVLPADHPDCSCVLLEATPALNQVVLSWSEYPGAASYSVYRSLVSGGPYLWIGNTADTVYVDDVGVLDQVYYYVVRPAALNGDELCQSNQVAAEALHPEPVVTVTPVVVSNLAKYYSGIAYLKLGEYENAIEYLGSYKKTDKVLAATATATIGDAWIELGDMDKGAEYYLKAAGYTSNDFLTPVFLMKAGQVYETMESFDKALEVYQKIQKEYPDSSEGTTIEKHIARVKLML